MFMPARSETDQSLSHHTHTQHEAYELMQAAYSSWTTTMQGIAVSHRAAQPRLVLPHLLLILLRLLGVEAALATTVSFQTPPPITRSTPMRCNVFTDAASTAWCVIPCHTTPRHLMPHYSSLTTPRHSIGDVCAGLVFCDRVSCVQLSPSYTHVASQYIQLILIGKKGWHERINIETEI
jgi:hypothetical protein